MDPSLPLKTFQKETPLPPSKTFCAYQKPARSFPAQTAFGARPSKKEDSFLTIPSYIENAAKPSSKRTCRVFLLWCLKMLPPDSAVGEISAFAFGSLPQQRLCEKIPFPDGASHCSDTPKTDQLQQPHDQQCLQTRHDIIDHDAVASGQPALGRMDGPRLPHVENTE